jgi:hypothetical protein
MIFCLKNVIIVKLKNSTTIVLPHPFFHLENKKDSVHFREHTYV